MTDKKSFSSIDEYIATFPDDTQKLLEEVRSTIKAAAPKAEEKISYDIPTYTLNGKKLIYFAGWKNHISIYPIPTGDDTFNQKISRYISGRGTVKFPIAEPIPFQLITQMVKLRMSDAVK
jgi:uncharacterized protein YdhG (YjbR/CyaY superfamily)